MRKALNENPMVQIVVIGLVGVIFAVMLFTTVLKKDEPVPTDPIADAAATEVAAAPAATAAPTPAPTAEGAAVAPVTDPATDVAAQAAADGLLPTKGLPKDVLIAFAKDKAIALLVVNPKGVADKKLKGYTQALSKRDDVEVFVVDVKDIADYARITSGVAVSRAPALIAIRPRGLTENVPTATVSYGFRSERSVEQALKDALYKGPNLPVYP